MTYNPSLSTEVQALPSLRALLTDIIDYAGLFPPAGLPLDEAIENFARYRRSADAWMLARFIIPVGKLRNLEAYAHLFEQVSPFRFSVLGSGDDNPKSFLSALDDDLNAIRTFNDQHTGLALVDVMEVRLPKSLLGQRDEAQQFMADVQTTTKDTLRDFSYFIEIPLDERLKDTLPAMLDAIAAHNSAHSDTIGLKMRTGGLMPDAFPTPAQVAQVLLACKNAGVRFKATAGLHHPVRHYNEGVQARMHGFFNLFCAAILANHHNLAAETVLDILMDESPASFRFGQNGFAWNNLAAPCAAIERARKSFAISFGSCSFDEPREDLQALGLLIRS